jgi:hypothetical protein
MASSTRQLPANYAAHGVLDFGRKGWTRTLLNLASLVVWLVCSGLLFWIVVRFRPDAEENAPAFGAADGTVGLIVIAVFLLGGPILLVLPHEGLHRVCYWLFTGERPSISRPGGYTNIAPSDCYLPKGLFLVVALAPLFVWSLVIAAAIAFVPGPTVYWLTVALTLNLAICTGDLEMTGWALRQPSGALFNDRGPVVTAYTPTL